MKDMVVTFDTFQLFRGWLKEVAYWNILAILVTPETSHPEIFPLKLGAPSNI